MASYVFGIDPGTKTGVAKYDKLLGRLTDVFTTDFWGCWDYFNYDCVLADQAISKIRIEVPRTKTNWHKKGCDITAANVGGAIREAKLLADGLEKLGYNVEMVHPQGKVDAGYIKRLTGWIGRTNEHTRDAIMLCYGF
jgi:hypothetical protein